MFKTTPPPKSQWCWPHLAFQISLVVVTASWLLSPSLGIFDLSILGNKYINTDFKYRTDPGAGLRNRWGLFFGKRTTYCFNKAWEMSAPFKLLIKCWNVDFYGINWVVWPLPVSLSTDITDSWGLRQPNTNLTRLVQIETNANWLLTVLNGPFIPSTFNKEPPQIWSE